MKPLLLLVLAASCLAQDSLERRANQRAIPFYVGPVIHNTWDLSAAHTRLATDASYEAIVSGQYSRSMLLIASYWSALEPTQGTFTWTGDEIAAYAAAHGQALELNALLYSQGTGSFALPAWVSSLSSADLLAASLTHVSTVLGHYSANYPNTPLWVYVTNELLHDDTPADHTIWYETGATFGRLPDNGLPDQAFAASGLESVYSAARVVCPRCKLGYNDFGQELENPTTGKLKNILDLVWMFQRDGAPIDFIGFQMHWAWNQSYSTSVVNGHTIISQLDANMNTLGALGLKVHISEMDVADSDGTHAAQQAAVFGDAMRTCFYNQYCESFGMWGVYDGLTWLTGQHPLLFDTAYQPKAAFTAVENAMPIPRIFPMSAPVLK
jgi:endo-1,4-beta-xylanase